MAENTKIEWCDHTFNPWEGCTKVSVGCAHCYAEARNARFAGGKAPNWGPGAPRRRTSAANWDLPHKWEGRADRFPKPARRPRVFCASLADWLDPEVPVEWLFDLLDLIRQTRHLDWLLLTKRPELWKERLRAVYVHERLDAWHPLADWVKDWLCGTPPENVWAGTTVENQEAAGKRVPELLCIPARVRFLSCEPLLEEVRLRQMRHNNDWDPPAVPDGIHWVICGGESGRDARPMHPDWARALRDDCQEAGVPFFFKQWGEWAPGHNEAKKMITPKPGEILTRFGKKVTGRRLDGRTWEEFPTAKPREECSSFCHPAEPCSITEDEGCDANAERCGTCGEAILQGDDVFHHALSMQPPSFGQAGVVSHLRCVRFQNACPRQ